MEEHPNLPIPYCRQNKLKINFRFAQWAKKWKNSVMNIVCVLAKNFTNYVFCHVQFSGVIQNIENRCAIRAKF